MSNISRRQFLKGAGVATLAVAAAGVLAGCSKKDVPVIPEVTTRPVMVIFMADKGNPNQWTEGYPAEELIREDIAHGDCFICLSEGRTVATFVLRSGVDPTYTVIYDGQWPDNRPYATIHRIASSGDRHGIFHHIIRFALTRYDTLRIDTHQDNAPMRHAIAKEGFTYCGLIHCWNGDERLAFHLSKTQKEE